MDIEGVAVLTGTWSLCNEEGTRKHYANSASEPQSVSDSSAGMLLAASDRKSNYHQYEQEGY